MPAATRASSSLVLFRVESAVCVGDPVMVLLQVLFQDSGIGDLSAIGNVANDFAFLHDVNPIGQTPDQAQILLNYDGCTVLLHCGKYFENIGYHYRCEPFRGLVDKQESGIADKGPTDEQYLALAAG
jgi:hypothetical protein